MSSSINLAYDSQIIIFYCFSFNPIVHGEGVPIKYDSATDKIQEYTRVRIEQNDRLGTINQVWDEISDEAAHIIVDDALKDRSFQLQFEAEGIPITRLLQQLLLKKFQSKMNKLKNKEWFDVISFPVQEERKKQARQFYKGLLDTPKMQAHLKRKGRKSPVPEGADIPLILFSSEFSVPVLSNDSDLTEFREELTEAGFNAQIIAFSEI